MNNEQQQPPPDAQNILHHESQASRNYPLQPRIPHPLSFSLSQLNGGPPPVIPGWGASGSNVNGSLGSTGLGSSAGHTAIHNYPGQNSFGLGQGASRLLGGGGGSSGIGGPPPSLLLNSGFEGLGTGFGLMGQHANVNMTNLAIFGNANFIRQPVNTYGSLGMGPRKDMGMLHPPSSALEALAERSGRGCRETNFGTLLGQFEPDALLRKTEEEQQQPLRPPPPPPSETNTNTQSWVLNMRRRMAEGSHNEKPLNLTQQHRKSADAGGGMQGMGFICSEESRTAAHPPRKCAQIVDVWAHNLESELGKIRSLIQEYPYVALDTEFPGIVAKPVGGEADNVEEYYYRTVKFNVDLMRVIQVGITLSNDRGTSPPGTSTWQFNFRFSTVTEVFAYESVAFLQTSGIDFELLEEHGIDPTIFGELLYHVGLVLNPDVKWITFHGTYDFAYMLRLVRGGDLPETHAEFFVLLNKYFPVFYDLKYIVQNPECKELNEHVSLQRLAQTLDVVRVGRQHQAGSDSLVTLMCFFRVMEKVFDYEIDDSLFLGVLYGLSGWRGTEIGGANGNSSSFLLGSSAQSKETTEPETSCGGEEPRNQGTEKLQRAWESTAARDAVTGARFMFGFEP